jgi:SAM-dependent methyltransferase
MTSENWSTIYRWEWFCRTTWLPHFRWVRSAIRNPDLVAEDPPAMPPLASSNPSLRWAGLKSVLTSIDARTVLDCSCGMGLKSIILHDMGFDVTGSDWSPVAVESANAIAKAERVNIEFFCSEWSDLAAAIGKQFDAIFCDGLSWTATRAELEAGLAGIFAVLKPGGTLIWSGAPFNAPGRTSDELIEEMWSARPKFSLEWSHESGEQHCTALRFLERFEDYIDAHHVYVIEELGWRKMEVATVREPAYWHAPLMNEILCAAGYKKTETKTLPIPNQPGTVTYNFSWRGT